MTTWLINLCSVTPSVSNSTGCEEAAKRSSSPSLWCTLCKTYETWTLSAADTRRLEAFHMKCQHQIARIRWQDHIRNTEVTTLTGLSPVSESIIRRRNSLFGHVTKLAEDTPAHQALRCHVDITLGRFPDGSWRRRPGHPRNRWLD